VGANNLDKGIDGDIATAFKETKTGYIWEIAFPWKVLPQLDVKEGTTLGFSLFIFDKDRDGTKKTLTLGVDNETNYRNPYVWRGIELVRFCQK
jgi:hypothetical protein